jgi:2-hydroxy-6-oxonona-2,4-dienedioate hydrolase
VHATMPLEAAWSPTLPRDRSNTPKRVLAFHCYRSTAPAGALIKVSPMRLSLWTKAFGSSHLSRFGYLRTPIPRDASPAAQADAHAALMFYLNISRAIVLGVSAGARSAVELALRHPNKVSALILICPGTYSPNSQVPVDSSRANKFTFWLVNNGADFVWWAVEKIAPSVLIRFVGVPPELFAVSSKAEQDRVMKIVRSVAPLSLRFPGINVDSTADLRELPLGQITAPTLIVSARDDGFNTLPAAEFAASKILDAKLIIYENGGHLLVGRADATRTAVRSFLAAVGSTG